MVRIQRAIITSTYVGSRYLAVLIQICFVTCLRFSLVPYVDCFKRSQIVSNSIVAAGRTILIAAVQLPEAL